MDCQQTHGTISVKNTTFGFGPRWRYSITRHLWPFVHFMARAKYYVFTINNPMEIPHAFVSRLDALSDVKYVIFQEESGENGTKHYQGYLELKARKRLAWLKRHISQEAHFEPRRGTAEQARDYCRKEESRISGPYESGTWSPVSPGQRTDLEAAIATLKRHGVKRVAEEHPTILCKYSRGIQTLALFCAPRRIEPPTVSLYYGKTGTGKTRYAFDHHPELYRKPPGTTWFDGYDCEDVLLLDDFCGASSKIRLDYLLQLLDRYPIQLEVKGGHTQLVATTIIVTSNIHPGTWYDYSTRIEHLAALARRFHHIYTFVDGERKEIDHEYFFQLPRGPIGDDCVRFIE